MMRCNELGHDETEARKMVALEPHALQQARSSISRALQVAVAKWVISCYITCRWQFSANVQKARRVH